METYKTVQDFANKFNITECYNKRFMKRKGGYVFQVIVSDKLVDLVITPLDDNNQPVIFSGSLRNKTIQSLRSITQFKIVE